QNQNSICRTVAWYLRTGRAGGTTAPQHHSTTAASSGSVNELLLVELARGPPQGLRGTAVLDVSRARDRRRALDAADHPRRVLRRPPLRRLRRAPRDVARRAHRAPREPGQGRAARGDAGKSRLQRV